MRNFIIAALMGAALVPGVAAAQNYDHRRDRSDTRLERRDYDHSSRSGDRRDYRSDRYLGANDSRRYRETDRALYRGGNWRSDYRYRVFRPGVIASRGYYQPRYYINDYSRFRLANPGFNRRWVRHYNDVLLVNIRTGRVINVRRNFHR